ncbi:ankyrin-1-like protein [Corchorus olitorius]|uniref:Ankyrin-1-like protein n=1 Tax=Corchorus olitorius TaxID=93759 RepID=A0A1R3KXB8_9ROSI|nr:ankyrin-1-like protein [Corchorus olitorius]
MQAHDSQQEMKAFMGVRLDGCLQRWKGIKIKMGRMMSCEGGESSPSSLFLFVIEPKFQRGTWFQWDVDRRPRVKFCTLLTIIGLE